MSFSNKLFKGFIRSAINQVGRDGGRVISNTIYKDSHSIPIRNVKNTESIRSDVFENNTNENIPEGFKYSFFSSKWYIYFFMIIGSIILYPISWLYFLIQGIIYFNKKTITYSGYVSQSVYASDKRFNTGRRYEGKRYMKKSIDLLANNEELSLNKKKGLYYFLILFIMYGIPMIYVYFTEF